MRRIAHAVLFSLVTASTPGFGHGGAAAPGEHSGHGAAIGMPGEPAKVARTVAVTMNDLMRFVPASITVKHGETIRFLVRNQGRIKHEMVLGTVAELKAHAEQMRKFPGMVHADPNQVSVDPGQTGELVWRFPKAGKIGFACLQPGHFEAGMKGSVTVR
ncbi:MAG: cupredoxin family protein [Betaproteobacteria bacterium]|nr:cupredoxin family protein [Betaproteobacteria bacterium]